VLKQRNAILRMNAQGSMAPARVEEMLSIYDEQLATLVPNAKHITKTNSGHEIHKEQPQLVIDAIREVVEAVRKGRTAPANFQSAR